MKALSWRTFWRQCNWIKEVPVCVKELSRKPLSTARCSKQESFQCTVWGEISSSADAGATWEIGFNAISGIITGKRSNFGSILFLFQVSSWEKDQEITTTMQQNDFNVSFTGLCNVDGNRKQTQKIRVTLFRGDFPLSPCNVSIPIRITESFRLERPLRPPSPTIIINRNSRINKAASHKTQTLGMNLKWPSSSLCYGWHHQPHRDFPTLQNLLHKPSLSTTDSWLYIWSFSIVTRGSSSVCQDGSWFLLCRPVRPRCT